MRRRHQPLSETPTGKAWIGQFGAADQAAAASLLDAMLLLNAEHVSQALRTELRALGERRPVRTRRLALYAERKLGGAPFFAEAMTPDDQGKLRLRAHGRNFTPVRPVRGGTRVGSEATIANVFSQLVGGAGGERIFVNSPGPDRIRAKIRPVQTIVIVTDLIGSGQRILTWLDALWKIKSVKSWVSRGLVDFAVVAVAATRSGEAKVRAHRLQPTVKKVYVAPVVSAISTDPVVVEWRRLIATVGPASGRGAARGGFGDEPCLV
ncbi:phosphoribosyltransferase-like protein, partial [Caulobacter sp.]|uniref:phosphoribosyltransferase-like protein n=1 Tax=Caulobacter sp. TaxID=78 RepID=UPI002B4728B2